MQQITKILLAEDLEDDAFLFRRSLSDKPDFCIVYHARDGDEAISYIDGRRDFHDRQKYPFPDIMVLDLKMPNRNGFEVLESVAKRYPTLIVGVFTSSEDPRDIRRAQDLGAHLYQAKTFDREAFDRFLNWLQQLARELPPEMSASVDS